jgi:hypothetical protein
MITRLGLSRTFGQSSLSSTISFSAHRPIGAGSNAGIVSAASDERTIVGRVERFAVNRASGKHRCQL